MCYFCTMHNEDDLLLLAVSKGIITQSALHLLQMEQQRELYLRRHKYRIQHSPDGRWRTYLPGENGKRKLIAKATKEKIEDAIVEYYSNAKEAPTEPTLTDIYPEWLEYRSTLTKSSSTIRRMSSVWNKWYKDQDIAKLPIKDLNYLYLSQWANSMVRNNEIVKRTYYLNTSVLRQLLDYAVEKGIIFENLFNRVKVSKKMFTRKRKPESATQVFLISEQEKIAAAAREKLSSRPWCVTPLFVLLNFQLGLRIGELVALKKEDIHEDYISICRMETAAFKIDGDRTVPDGFKVEPYLKSNAGFRNVYLNSVAKELIQDILNTLDEYGYHDNGFIFVASRNHKRGTCRTFTKYLSDLCDAAGVVKKSSHKIRKTYISSLFDSGVNINTIREQAGHEDEQTSLNNYCFDQRDQSEKYKEIEKAVNKRMVI